MTNPDQQFSRAYRWNACPFIWYRPEVSPRELWFNTSALDAMVLNTINDKKLTLERLKMTDMEIETPSERMRDLLTEKTPMDIKNMKAQEARDFALKLLMMSGDLMQDFDATVSHRQAIAQHAGAISTELTKTREKLRRCKEHRQKGFEMRKTLRHQIKDLDKMRVFADGKEDGMLKAMRVFAGKP